MSKEEDAPMSPEEKKIAMDKYRFEGYGGFPLVNLGGNGNSFIWLPDSNASKREPLWWGKKANPRTNT